MNRAGIVPLGIHRSAGGYPCPRRHFLRCAAAASLAFSISALQAQVEDISPQDANFLLTAIETIEKHSLRRFTQPEIIAGACTELRKTLGEKYRAHFADRIPPDADLDLAGNIYVRAILNVAKAAPAGAQDFAVRVLMERSLNLFLETFDDYSEFIPGSIAPELLRMEHSVEYVGVGVELTRRDEGIVCIPYPSENASLAGVLKGDLLVQIEGRDTGKMTIYEAAQRLRGVAGAKVNILVRQGGAQGVNQAITIERAKLQRAPLEVRPDKGFGHHLRISAIMPTTANALKQELLALGPDKALLLDFRGNPGGSVADSVRIAQLFLPKGTPIATLERSGGKQKFISESAAPYVPARLNILQDQLTASGAELIIAALTAHAPLRVRTFGTRTFGKGIVQDLLALKGGEWGIVKITSFKIYGPRNEDWNGKGLPADNEMPKELAR